MSDIREKNNIVTILLALYCILLPFEEALASSFGSILKIVAMLLIAYIVMCNLKNRTFYLHKYYVPLVLWLIYMAVSVFWVNSISWWQYFIRIYTVQVIFVCVIEMVPIEKINLDLIKYSIIAGGCIASAFLILMPTASALTDEGRRTIILLGTELDPNIVASIIILGAQIALEKFYTVKKRTLLVGCLTAWQVFGILLTGSRGALIAFVFGFLLQLVLKMSERGQRKRAILLAVFGIIAIIIILSVLPENLMETRFSEENILGLNELKSGSHNRYTIWLYALGLIRKNPIWGYGCGNFFTAIQSVYRMCASHNLYILLFVESGLIGVIFFFRYIFKILKDLFKIKDYSTFSLITTILVMGGTLDSISYKYFWIALIFARLMIRERESNL